MRVFTYTKNEIEKIKNKWIWLLLLGLSAGIISCLLIFIFHDRFKMASNYLLVVFISLITTIYCLYIAFLKLRTIKEYTFILRKAENSSKKERYVFVSQDEDIKVFNSISYKVLNFCKDDQNYFFYFLYDSEANFKEGQVVDITFVDDVALDYEVIANE